MLMEGVVADNCQHIFQIGQPQALKAFDRSWTALPDLSVRAGPGPSCAPAANGRALRARRPGVPNPTHSGPLQPRFPPSTAPLPESLIAAEPHGSYVAFRPALGRAV